MDIDMALIRALGLMSGTSMDGIDLAVVTTDGDRSVTRGPAMFVPYDAGFRRRIEAALETAKGIAKRDERPGDLAELERELTLRHARAVSVLVEKHGAVDVIGFHGQTVLHRPEKALTVQIGDGALLACETATPVVHDMRAADMAEGGQGAPLVPAFHAALAATLRGTDMPACFVNIGGISNITFVAADGPPVAFDSGPGNALIDQWVSREGGVPFDQNGMIASEGGVVRGVVERYLGSPFFARSGPKSLDRNDFTLELATGLELADGARTLAAVSAEAILNAAAHMPTEPKSWIICGGGRKNPHIVADLRKGADAQGARVLLAEDVGFDGDAMEAEAWAYLAVRAMRGLPLTWPTTTGCRAPATGGVVSRPD
jgi:anhydro-N-acetylmuramic acid kinase